MDNLLQLAADPGAWGAPATLSAKEVALGLDNVVFIVPG
jgi:predicted tellurium resistance membrane protein TerC